jgi:hypothetical protein
VFSQPGAHIDALARCFLLTHMAEMLKNEMRFQQRIKSITKVCIFGPIECFVFNAGEMSASADSLETHCEIAGIILNAWLY